MSHGNGREVGTGEDCSVTALKQQRIPGRKNLRKNTPRHIIIKLTKIKERDKILKAKGEKKTTYKETPISLSAYFSTETLKLYNSENSLLRREWHDIFKVMTLQRKEYNT